MQIVYAKPNQIAVSGTAQDMSSVGRSILNFASSELGALVIEAETDFDPSPYDIILSRMSITRSEGPVRISVLSDEQLQVEGSAESLEVLASFFDFPADTKSGHHSHYEYYEGNEWIAADSEPVVVCVL